MFQPSNDQYAPPLYGNVLIIENDPIQQQIIHLILRKMGLSTSVIFADEKTFSELNKDPFDAVLIDSVLQFVDSTSLISKLRQAAYSKAIIMLMNDNDSPDQYIEAGCDSFCKKPLDQNELYQILKPHLACSAAACRDKPIVSNLLNVKPEMEIIVLAYIHSLPGMLNQIRKLFKTEQWPKLLLQTHQLYGSRHGFPALENCVRTLELQIKKGDINHAQRCMTELQIICQRIYLGLHQ